MTRSLTRRQRQVLDCITSFIERHEYSPSLEEIGAALGLSSLATVHVHLRNLEQKGLIRRLPNRSRSVEVVSRQRNGSSEPIVRVPLLGRVAAGNPIEAIISDEFIELPAEFIRGGETFALKVQGDSMIEEHIRDGDTILVERRDTARNGETVVALIRDSEVTVKKFYSDGSNQIRLQPANETMAPIIVHAEDCRIQGIVIGLLRKY